MRHARHAPVGWVSILALLAIAATAAYVRSIALDHRPVHGDEANQAYKTGILLETGRYVYDPHDHHGPTLYYAAATLIRGLGIDDFADTEIWMYRAVPLAFSVATILCLLLVRDALGPWSICAAGALLSVSPAFTFYSRYFIQETLLVFFTVLALACVWRYMRRPSIGWALGIGISVALMHATKETAVIAVFAFGVAWTGVVLWRHGWRRALPVMTERAQGRHVLVAIAGALVVNVILFTAFFTHLRGPLDSVLTYANYIGRAGGAGIHDKPWDYYLRLLIFTKRAPGPWWSEAPVLMAGLGGIAYSLMRGYPREGNRWVGRFLSLFALTLWVVYSLIPYKTPWSMLTAYLVVVLLAGFAIGNGLRAAPPGWRRVLVLIALALGLSHLGLQSYRAESVYAADVRNPYVYAHTSTAFLRLDERIKALQRIRGEDLTVQVVQPDKDYWPLPWYLRRVEAVGYWVEIPQTVDADVVICAPEIREAVEARMVRDYFGPESHGLRPSVLRAVYIEQSLWDRFLEMRAAERDQA